jgi:hypothetical protein
MEINLKYPESQMQRWHHVMILQLHLNALKMEYHRQIEINPSRSCNKSIITQHSNKSLMLHSCRAMPQTSQGQAH